MINLGGVGEYLALHPYLYAAAIFVLAIIIAEFLLYFFKHFVEKLVKKTKTKLDNQIVFRIEHPIIIIVILIGLLLATRQIITSAYFFENLIITIIVFVVSYMFTGVANILITYWQKVRVSGESNSAFHDEVLPLMKSLIKIVISIIAIIVVLQVWGVQVGTLIASIGIVGIILGFAFQDTMKNIFGGIALISDNSIKKHDVIQLDTGEVGEVIEMSLRSTKLKTLDNDYLMVPNGTLANSRFINFALPTATMRISVFVSVAYGTDPHLVKTVLLETLKGRNDILSLPRREVRFLKMGDFSMDFELLFYIRNYKERFTIIDSVTTDVYLALERYGIEIPFPTRTVYTSSKNSSPKEEIKKRKDLAARRALEREIQLDKAKEESDLNKSKSKTKK
ncbi:mechanosensitive ion channel family protein [Candidatus Woesearchaeota archaeon]|nr:mechanosensitive ion channel family protein [Candidatus Woesearchaeota archaeon]